MRTSTTRLHNTKGCRRATERSSKHLWSRQPSCCLPSRTQTAICCPHTRYVKDSSSGRVRLLYSASHFRARSDSGERNKIGRANRLLHWHEIVTLKDLGFGLYDLGGIPLDSSDQEKNDIARFKLEFGGEMLIEYNGVLPTNVVGKLLSR